MMCVSPFITTRLDGSLVAVPCGHCVECLRDWQNDWSFRLSEEMKHVSCPLFVTLTYNDENLPTMVDSDGVEKSVVIKSEVQNFLKRLRKNIPELKNNLRYFALGEYGAKYNRAHYHLVLLSNYWNNVFDADRDIIEAWQGRGFVKTRFCTKTQVGYITKYMNKIDKRPHIVEPFRLMSKGLGLCFLTDRMIEYYLTTFDNTCRFNGFNIRLPRYYVKKLDSISTSYYNLKRCGLSYSEVRDLREKHLDENSHYWYFDYFCNNFEEVYQSVYASYVSQCRKHNYQIHELSINECFYRFRKQVSFLRELEHSSNRLIDKVAIKNRITAFDDYIISHGHIERSLEI